MADPKGEKLYVNLGASQARRRLKGFGHGVRKVQTAGRHQAVVIHTATGQHLVELQAKFSDVGSSTRPNAECGVGNAEFELVEENTELNHGSKDDSRS